MKNNTELLLENETIDNNIFVEENILVVDRNQHKNYQRGAEIEENSEATSANSEEIKRRNYLLHISQ